MFPRQTLITHSRLGRHFWPLIEALPRGTGIRVRREEEAHASRIAVVARANGLVLTITGDADLAVRLGASFVHAPKSFGCPLPYSLPVHNEAEARIAAEQNPAFVYVSPIRPTRTHPGEPALHWDDALRLARMAGVPALALGGVGNVSGWAPKPPFVGWAGIDAFLVHFRKHGEFPPLPA